MWNQPPPHAPFSHRLLKKILEVALYAILTSIKTHDRSLGTSQGDVCSPVILLGCMVLYIVHVLVGT